MDATIDVGGKRLREDLERLERFRLLDDTFMRQVFRGQLGLAQHVLRILTGLDGLTLVKEETQHDLKRATGSKSPVLDVWGTDETAGEDFDALPQRWVVVVLERDPDGPQRRCRHYRAREEDGSTLDDGAHLLYVNAAWRGDDELGRLMADFCERDPDRNRVRYLKRDPEGVREMCRISEEIFNEGVEQGIEQGARDKLLENVRSMVRNLQITAQQALDALDVPESERAEIIAML